MSLLFVSTLLAAQEPVKIKLWQNGAPNDNGMTSQVEKGPLYVAEPTIESALCSRTDHRSLSR